MNSPEFQKYIDELAGFFNKKFSKKELYRRIAEAVSTQDSCGECEALNIKTMLNTGEDGHMTCASCTKEVASWMGIKNEESKD